LLLTPAEINTLVGGPIDISPVRMTGAEFGGSTPPRTRGVRIGNRAKSGIQLGFEPPNGACKVDPSDSGLTQRLRQLRSGMSRTVLLRNGIRSQRLVRSVRSFHCRQSAVSPACIAAVGLDWSAVDGGHVPFVVAFANGRSEVVEPCDLFSAQLDAIGGGVLLDASDPLGPGDRGDVAALGE
jgi:hypothetical protein